MRGHVGFCVGTVGSIVGARVCPGFVGLSVGIGVGRTVGIGVGRDVGAPVGLVVGT